MKRNKTLRNVLSISLVVLSLSLCCILGYLAATGGWNLLVNTVQSIISQGPAAVISAVIAALFSVYVLVPLAIFITWIVAVYFIYIR